jgi:hypothetical protein
MFEKYGGFRVDLGRSSTNLLGREDIEFANRLIAGGERLWYEPRAVVRSMIQESRLEQGYALRWWYWYARSEVADLGPPETRWCIIGVPLALLRRLARWSVQWLISLGAARRFSAKRRVWYLAGFAVGCHQWTPRQRSELEVFRAQSGTPTSKTDAK